VIKWARATNKGDWRSSTCAHAAAGGRLEILQWARANGCEWDAFTCESAAHNGHLDVLQWAVANGCEWDARVCFNLAGKFPLVQQWIRENAGPGELI
jgi:hypothetical protein